MIYSVCDVNLTYIKIFFNFLSVFSFRLSSTSSRSRSVTPQREEAAVQDPAMRARRALIAEMVNKGPVRQPLCHSPPGESRKRYVDIFITSHRCMNWTDYDEFCFHISTKYFSYVITYYYFLRPIAGEMETAAWQPQLPSTSSSSLPCGER